MKALVLFPNGSEEMEATVSCNVMTRAGIEVVKATVENWTVSQFATCTMRVWNERIVPDVSLESHGQIG